MNANEDTESMKFKHKNNWSSALPFKCHCVDVCAFAHEKLHNMQMCALGSCMQSSEALSAKEMGQSGIKNFRFHMK